MSADKRTPHTDALDTLGTIIGDNERRDAIHLAVEPVIAAQSLLPGEDVGFVEGGVGKCKNPVGIVDPFLKGKVKKGEKFWLVVYPRMITSLRHVWTHPDFPVVAEVAEDAKVLTEVEKAKQWIHEYAMSFPLSVDMLMEYAEDWVRSQRNGQWGDYLVLGGLLEGEYVSDEFWNQYEIVMGEKVDENHRGSFFSCSC
jgi:hypothetical protein